MTPIWLGPNQPPRFFDGGAAIARLRGVPERAQRSPEDWVASTTTLFGETEVGLTRLPDGRWLHEAIGADPISFLGPAHAEVWGADPALLVKLLDAGQRLPVHCHPDRDFARRHLDCPYGKTEAWVVVEAAGSSGVVYLGFRDEMADADLTRMVDGQDTDAMLGAMNRVPVTPGDAILVPAGLPHAIGAGVFVVELQEPTDLSVLMEWDGFDIDGARDGHLKLGFEVALDAVDRSGWDERRIEGLRERRPAQADTPTGIDVLLPPAADPYFRAERIRPQPEASLAPDFSVLVVLSGDGKLATERGGDHGLGQGDVVLLPYGSGTATISGELDTVRCRPPAPGLARGAA